MASDSFQQHLQALRQQVEVSLQSSLQGRGWPQPLAQAVEYSLMAGGKRLRPVLVLLASDLCAGSQSLAISPACAIEMIHTYSLIHDDLPAMDNDDYRRGRLTSHKVFGEALAILAGDALLTLAFEVLGETAAAAEIRAELTVVLARAAGGAGMVGGQVLDLAAERGSFPGKEALTTFMVSPLMMPGLVVGVAMVQLMREMGLRDAYISLLIGHVVITLPYVVRNVL
ncbi:MAG: polyprenyl synthetase family protein, partial [Planctomyces sp.]